MKLIHSLVYIFILIYIFNDIICGDVHSFIFSLPSAVGATLRNTWSDIIKLLKAPMRLRKKRKKNKTKSSTTIATPTPALTPNETNIYTESIVKPTIPIFYHPEWTVFDWRTLQRPSLERLIEKIREMKVTTTINGMDSYRGTIIKKQRLSEENDEDKYGVLFFI